MKTTQLYQGRDWVTSRPSVADLFETLEEIHDLCLAHQNDIDFDESEDVFELLRELHYLIENLTSQCAMTLADLIPRTSIISPVGHLWHSFEVYRILAHIKKKALALTNEESENEGAELARLAMDIKNCIKQMDQ